ncbi:MAG: CII family transcriptional regulator [Hafnia sp.]
MEHAKTRNNSQDIEVRIRGLISRLGLAAVAKGMGLDKSQISRMQTGQQCFVEKVAKFLEVIGFCKDDSILSIAGDEAAEIAKSLRMLSMIINSEKKKSPTAVTADDSQITMTF